MKPALAARLAAAATERERNRLHRRRRLRERTGGLINFSSNDYLGLAGHPAIAAAMADGACNHGSGAGAATLVSGYRPIHQRLEAALAGFTGFEAALLTTSGYQANLAIGTALCGRGAKVAADRLDHASINDALRLAGARIQRYAHGDAAAADSRLENGASLLVTDTVFSMDGDLAPLPQLVDACDRHACTLWVDDAHGFGVMGEHGRGALEHFAIPPQRVDAYVATFGKALGTGGAFIAGDRALIEHMVNTARPLIYSTALSPALAAATLQALKVLRNETWRRTKLNANILYFRERARRLGVPLTASTSAIQPILLGDNAAALAASEQLEIAGFLVVAMRPPTVPVGSARLRITLSAAHETAHIDSLLDALTACLLDGTVLATAGHNR